MVRLSRVFVDQHRLDNMSFPIYLTVKAILAHAAEHGLPELARPGLEVARAALAGMTYETHARRYLYKLEELLGAEDDLVLDEADPWARDALEQLQALPDERRGAWAALLKHARDVRRAAPSATWQREAAPLVQAVGQGDLAQRVPRWVAGLKKATPRDTNADLLRGLLHATPLLDGEAREAMTGTLAEAVERGCRRAERGGLVSSMLAKAAVLTLGQLGDRAAAQRLAWLAERVKSDWIIDDVQQQLAQALESAGVAADELEEAVVDDFGMQQVGRLERALGQHTALVLVDGPGATRLVWRQASGKEQKSVPAAVKRTHADEVKALRKNASEMKKVLAAQRDRLDASYLEQRNWPVDRWLRLYIHHPLLGVVGRRLVWTVATKRSTRACAWDPDKGRLTDVAGKAVKPARTAEVRLWHPLEAGDDEVAAWQRWLERRLITQPFKQAHREVYRVTAAERQTATYSNRFAGHVLRQHQLNVLRQQRGWEYSLMGQWDSYDRPTLRLDPWNLRAELWVERIAEDEASDMGVLLYVATDQVRFLEGQACDPTPLADVPPLVFSEVMRQVDLFTGVCSIGNDPRWADRGDALDDYWSDFSFGELGATGRTRAEILGRLLPALAIADRCSLDGRFLRVRGDLRTYRIHLGSGNVLMEPGEQYLCIVADHSRGSRTNLFLPFEGDVVLSTIISKALLLAADNKIEDPTIREQIES